MPAFDVRRQPTLFANGNVLRCRDDAGIRFPEVRKAQTRAIRCRDALPQSLTGSGAAITDDVGDDLPRAPAERNPNPAFVGFFQHK